ncbi:hypothetical protein BKA63DRAFT_138302 [Paraphoma chrysanthemicola]|nr:hypothetical protein BKA63DRAFT_138302 [Paraphoma chrysanthemicola]
MATNRMRQHAGFLDLPGETRNQIYKFTLTNENDLTDPVLLIRHCDQPATEGTVRSRSLTQLCRLVRREFMPIYMRRHIFVRVKIRDIEAYVTTFFDPRNFDLFAELFGHIEVDLDVQDDQSNASVNLLPLMQLMLRAPKLNMGFDAIHMIHPSRPPAFLHEICLVLRLMKVPNNFRTLEVLLSMQKVTLTLPLSTTSIPELRLWLWSRPGASPPGYIHDLGFSNFKELRVVIHHGVASYD